MSKYAKWKRTFHIQYTSPGIQVELRSFRGLLLDPEPKPCYSAWIESARGYADAQIKFLKNNEEDAEVISIHRLIHGEYERD